MRRLVVSAATVSTDAMSQELQLLKEENCILTDAAADSEQLHVQIEELQSQLLQLQRSQAAAPAGGVDLKSCMADLHAQREENRLWRQRVAAYEQEIDTEKCAAEQGENFNLKRELESSQHSLEQLLESSRHAKRSAEAANEKCAAEQGENFNLKQELESSQHSLEQLLESSRHAAAHSGLLRDKNKEKLDRAEEVCRGVYATLQLVNCKLSTATKRVVAAEFEQYQAAYLQLVYRRLQEETGGKLSRGVAWQLYSMLDMQLTEDEFECLLAELVDGKRGRYVDFYQVTHCH